MKILMLNWKDLANPTSGGAEVLTEGILAELVRMGHEVTLLTCQFPGAQKEELVNGYRVIRRGKYYTVQIAAFFLWFTRFRREKYDIVVDQVHGIPFFTIFYVPNKKRFAFIHEVAGDIWDKMFHFPIAQIGRALERFYLYLYRRTPFITVSESTKADLLANKIPEENISIIPEAITIPSKLPSVTKNAKPTIIFVGRLAPMKQVDVLILAAAIVAKMFPELELWIVGAGEERYVQSLKVESEKLKVKAMFFGKVAEEKKYELLGRASVLASASLKEGFGLVIIEAGLMGTPGVVYNVAGFRDAVVDGKTGVLAKTNSPEGLAHEITALFKDQSRYQRLSLSGMEYSKEFTFAHAAREFEKIIKSVY